MRPAPFPYTEAAGDAIPLSPSLSPNGGEGDSGLLLRWGGVSARR